AVDHVIEFLLEPGDIDLLFADDLRQAAIELFAEITVMRVGTGLAFSARVTVDHAHFGGIQFLGGKIKSDLSSDKHFVAKLPGDPALLVIKQGGDDIRVIGRFHDNVGGRIDPFVGKFQFGNYLGDRVVVGLHHGENTLSCCLIEPLQSGKDGKTVPCPDTGDQ